MYQILYLPLLLKKVYYKCMNIRNLHLYKKCSFYPLQPEVDMTHIPVIISDIPLSGNYVLNSRTRVESNFL